MLKTIIQSLIRFIRSFERRQRQCFAFQRTMARYLKCSVRTIQNAIAALTTEDAWERFGARLKVTRRGPTSAVYELLGAPDNRQLSFDFAGGPCGSSCVSSPPASISESSESLRRERREYSTPVVIFLRPERPDAPRKKTLTEHLREALSQKLTEWGVPGCA